MILTIKGDCLKEMKHIEEHSIDMVLCDLPYGTTSCQWDNIIPFESLWKQYKRIVKTKGRVVLFSAQPFTTKLINSNLKDFSHIWYWKKNNITGGIFCKVQPMRCIEDICVFTINKTSSAKGKAIYNPQGLKALDKPIRHKVHFDEVYHGKKNDSIQIYTNYPKNLIEFDNEAASNKNRLHPTQKPVKLLEYLIRTYTNENDTVLDNCMGSGSTAIACINTKRNFIGIELEPKYYAIAENRINAYGI